MSAKRSYKQILIRCREMRGQNGLAAYDRAKMLCEVFDDRDFRIDAGALDDFETGEKLNIEVDDLALGFLELRAMLEHFPKREQWQDGLLKRMHAEMLEARKPVKEQAPTQRPRVTKEELEAVKEEKDRLETRATYLAKDLGEARDELNELRRENTELKRQLARAEGRIEELERAMNRELAGAV